MATLPSNQRTADENGAATRGVSRSAAKSRSRDVGTTAEQVYDANPTVSKARRNDVYARAKAGIHDYGES